MSDQIVQSFQAGGTIAEYTFVSIDTAGKVQTTTLPTDDNCVGVAQRAASSGDMVDVVIFGITRVIAGESITFSTNPLLAVTTGGKAQIGASAGEYPVCRVLPNVNQVSAVDGDQIRVLFFGPSIVVA